MWRPYSDASSLKHRFYTRSLVAYTVLPAPAVRSGFLCTPMVLITLHCLLGAPLAVSGSFGF